MTIKIWHNLRCTKSRKTLELLNSKRIHPDIRLYLENPPQESEIKSALKKLNMQAIELLRTNELEYKEFVKKNSNQKPSNEQAIRWMLKSPKLIQRPIVFNTNNGKVVIGRPPENVLKII